MGNNNYLIIRLLLFLLFRFLQCLYGAQEDRIVNPLMGPFIHLFRVKRRGSWKTRLYLLTQDLDRVL
jgi:hypothetical protein